MVNFSFVYHVFNFMVKPMIDIVAVETIRERPIAKSKKLLDDMQENQA